MSNFRFCTSCGAKIEYANVPPKFCSSCGASIVGGAAQASRAEPRREGFEGDVYEIEEGYTNATSVPKLDKIDAKVEMVKTTTTLSFDKDKGFVFEEKEFEKRTKDL